MQYWSAVVYNAEVAVKFSELPSIQNYPDLPYPSEGPGGRRRANDRNASIVGRKCADDVVVSVRYVVTVVRI